MLDETAKDKGYALMCVAEPLSDCRIRVIEEVSNPCCMQPPYTCSICTSA